MFKQKNLLSLIAVMQLLAFGFAQAQVAKATTSTLNYDRNGTVELSTYLGRYFYNERVFLRQVLGIDSRFRGYNVEAVMVDIRDSRAGLIDLLVNNQVVQRQNAYYGQMYMQLYGSNTIDETVRSLQLGVLNSVYIENVHVILRAPGYAPPPPGGPGYPPPYNPPPPGSGYYEEVRAPLSVSQHMQSNDHLSLRNFIDLNTYQGYRLAGIQFTATPTQAQTQSQLSFVANGQQLVTPVAIAENTQFYEVRFALMPELNWQTDLQLYNTNELDIQDMTLILIHER